MTREERILAIVFAKGTVIRPSSLNPNMVIVVNGLTGRDACERTAEQCFDALFDEEDTGQELNRAHFVITPDGPSIKLTGRDHP